MDLSEFMEITIISQEISQKEENSFPFLMTKMIFSFSQELVLNHLMTCGNSIQV